MSQQTAFVTKGTTNVTIDVGPLLQDNSGTNPGDPITGLVYNSASLVCYFREGGVGAVTQLTLATQTVTGAHSDGGFVELSSTNMPGMYRLDLSDTIVSGTVNFASVTLGGFANLASHTVHVILTNLDLYEGVRAGLTSLPNAAAEAAGGLYTRGSGVGQINQPANGRIDNNTISIGGTTQTANDNGADINAILLDTAEIGVAGAGLTNINLPDQTMDITGSITTVVGDIGGDVLGNVAGSVINDVVGSVGSVTGHTPQTADHTANIAAILTDTGTTLDTKINDIQGATFSSATDSLEAIRDRGDAAWTTGAGGTPPNLLQSTTIATLASQTEFTLTAGSADNTAYRSHLCIITDQSTSTQKAVEAVSVYTGATRTVFLVRAPAFTIAVGDTIDIVAGDASAAWDEVLTGGRHNVATSSGRRMRSIGDAVGGTVNDASATTTAFITTLVGSHDDHFADQTMYFTSGDLVGMSRIITTYTSSTQGVTFDEAFPAAPANGDSFEVNPVHVHTKTQTAAAIWDEVISKAAHDVPGSGAKLLRELGVIIAAEGQVSGTPTTTVFTTNITGYDDDFFKDQVVSAYNGAAMAGQGRVVSAYNGTTGVFTVDEAFTTALSAGDDVVVFTPHVHPVSQIRDSILADSTPFNGADIPAILADTADIQPKIGTPAADISADIAAVPAANRAEMDTNSTRLTAILLDTAEIGIGGIGLSEAGGTGDHFTALLARMPTAAQLAYIVAHAELAKPVTFTGGTTTTAVLGNVDGSAASSTDDVYNGRMLIFNLGTLDVQVADITDYVGSTTTATISAVTTAVTSSHTAILV
ncbi:hypothetical protein KAR91_17160 [Candidatus Pacearchaeota archaeon]|nr:hypothetical protein [Candidatus Pacearchaeota archaeon]